MNLFDSSLTWNNVTKRFLTELLEIMFVTVCDSFKLLVNATVLEYVNVSWGRVCLRLQQSQFVHVTVSDQQADVESPLGNRP